MAAGLGAVDGGRRQGAHLHAVERGLHDREAHSSDTQHRVVLVPAAGGAEQRCIVAVELAPGVGHLEGGHVGQELVQRRIEQADR